MPISTLLLTVAAMAATPPVPATMPPVTPLILSLPSEGLFSVVMAEASMFWAVTWTLLPRRAVVFATAVWSDSAPEPEITPPPLAVTRPLKARVLAALTDSPSVPPRVMTFPVVPPAMLAVTVEVLEVVNSAEEPETTPPLPEFTRP